MARRNANPAIVPFCLVTGTRRNLSTGPITFRSDKGFVIQTDPDGAGEFEAELPPSVKAGYYEADLGEGVKRGTRDRVRIWVPNVEETSFDSTISRKP